MAFGTSTDAMLSVEPSQTSVDHGEDIKMSKSMSEEETTTPRCSSLPELASKKDGKHRSKSGDHSKRRSQRRWVASGAQPEPPIPRPCPISGTKAKSDGARRQSIRKSTSFDSQTALEKESGSDKVSSNPPSSLKRAMKRNKTFNEGAEKMAAFRRSHSLEVTSAKRAAAIANNQDNTANISSSSRQERSTSLSRAVQKAKHKEQEEGSVIPSDTTFTTSGAVIPPEINHNENQRSQSSLAKATIIVNDNHKRQSSLAKAMRRAKSHDGTNGNNKLHYKRSKSMDGEKAKTRQNSVSKEDMKRASSRNSSRRDSATTSSSEKSAVSKEDIKRASSKNNRSKQKQSTEEEDKAKRPKSKSRRSKRQDMNASENNVTKMGRVRSRSSQKDKKHDSTSDMSTSGKVQRSASMDMRPSENNTATKVSRVRSRSSRKDKDHGSASDMCTSENVLSSRRSTSTRRHKKDISASEVVSNTRRPSSRRRPSISTREKDNSECVKSTRKYSSKDPNHNSKSGMASSECVKSTRKSTPTRGSKPDNPKSSMMLSDSEIAMIVDRRTKTPEKRSKTPEKSRRASRRLQAAQEDEENSPKYLMSKSEGVHGSRHNRSNILESSTTSLLSELDVAPLAKLSSMRRGKTPDMRRDKTPDRSRRASRRLQASEMTSNNNNATTNKMSKSEGAHMTKIFHNLLESSSTSMVLEPDIVPAPRRENKTPERSRRASRRLQAPETVSHKMSKSEAFHSTRTKRPDLTPDVTARRSNQRLAALGTAPLSAGCRRPSHRAINVGVAKTNTKSNSPTRARPRQSMTRQSSVNNFQLMQALQQPTIPNDLDSSDSDSDSDSDTQDTDEARREAAAARKEKSLEQLLDKKPKNDKPMSKLDELEARSRHSILSRQAQDRTGGLLAALSQDESESSNNHNPLEDSMPSLIFGGMRDKSQRSMKDSQSSMKLSEHSNNSSHHKLNTSLSGGMVLGPMVKMTPGKPNKQRQRRISLPRMEGLGKVLGASTAAQTPSKKPRRRKSLPSQHELDPAKIFGDLESESEEEDEFASDDVSDQDLVTLRKMFVGRKSS